MSAHPRPHLNPEEYLAIDRAADLKSEYYDGRMYAMAGGSVRHGVIIPNLYGELGQALKGKSRTLLSNDVRLRVAPKGLYTYPDAMVVCGTIQATDDHHDTVLNPALIVEVLSPSTEAYDRGFKFEQYRSLESLREYALVSQRRPCVEIYRRREQSEWVLHSFIGLDARCQFESIACAIDLSEIYRNVTFDAEVDIRSGAGT
jgi:Uma2 family endonuclease